MTISQRSASIIAFTHFVLDIVNNTVFFYGDEATALDLEFQNDRYLSAPIGGFTIQPRLK
jgi:hypothetical protein